MSDCNACLTYFVNSGYFIAYHPKIIKKNIQVWTCLLKGGIVYFTEIGPYLFVFAALCDEIKAGIYFEASRCLTNESYIFHKLETQYLTCVLLNVDLK